MTTMVQLADAVGTYIIASLPANARQLVRGRVGDGPAPSRPYIIYRLESLTHPDFTRTEYIGDDQIIHANTVATFVVTVVGDRPGQLAIDDATRIALGLRLTQRTQDLYKICGLWSVEQARDLSALEIGTMRSRAELRIVLSVSTGITAAREYFESVAVDVVSDAPPASVSVVIGAPVDAGAAYVSGGYVAAGYVAGADAAEASAYMASGYVVGGYVVNTVALSAYIASGYMASGYVA